jgi:Uma2 family endonuclease
MLTLFLMDFNQTIEILMPGKTHELFKSIIGMLIELFCLEQSIEFEPTGSMTQELAGEVSLEADESYSFGTFKPLPDLAVEVILTSGSPDKLQRYRALGIAEVWFWQDGLFTLYHLRNGVTEIDYRYEQINSSEIPELATLDIDLLRFNRRNLPIKSSPRVSARIINQQTKELVPIIIFVIPFFLTG